MNVKNRIPKNIQNLFFNNLLLLVSGFISIIDTAVSIAPTNANWHPTPPKTRIANNKVYIIFLDAIESIAPKIINIENKIKNNE